MDPDPDPYPDPCIKHIGEVLKFSLSMLANCVPFDLSLRMRGSVRYINDPYCTSVDCALENLSKLDEQETLNSIRVGLEFIQTFLTVIDADFYEQHGDLVRGIEYAFEKRGLELESAIQKGDAAGVHRGRQILRRLIEHHKPRIREAYDGFAIEGATAFLWQNITDPHFGGWNRLSGFLVRNAETSSLARAAPVLMLFREVVSVIQVFGNFSSTEKAVEKHHERLRQVRVHLKRVAFCLGRILFLWWVDETEEEKKAIMLSDLLMKMMPTSPEILDTFLNSITSRRHRHCPEHVLVDCLVDHMVFLSSSSSGSSGEEESGSLSTFRNVLRSLVEYLVDRSNLGSQPPKDVKQLRSDIRKVVCNVASLKYSSIKFKLSHHLQVEIALMKVEIALTALRGNNSNSEENWESIDKELTLSSLQTSCLLDHHLDQDDDVNSASEKLVLNFNRIEQVVREAQSVHRLLLSWVEDRDTPSSWSPTWRPFLENETRDEFYAALQLKFVLDFKLLRMQALLMDHMRRTPSLFVHLKDQIHTLYKRLEFLFNYFSVLSMVNRGHKDLILSCKEIVDTEETVVFNFSESNEVSEQIINRMSVLVSNLLKKVINVPVSDFEDTNLQFQISIVLTMPKTHLGLAFLDLLLEKLNEFLKNKADSIGYSLRHRIEDSLIKDLDSIRSFLDEVGEKRNQNQELKDLRRRVTQAAYQADYVIDSILLGNYDWCHVLWLFNFMDEVKTIKSESTKIVQMKNDFAQVQDGVQTSDSEHEMISQTSAPEFAGEKVVSLDDQEEIIINRLTRGTSQRREVVTIFGMPGIGKTTLAKKLYDNPRVNKYFHKLAWCCVSQVYRRKELLLKILSDVTQSTDDIHTKTDQELLEMMRKRLKGQRYLVVMDDVWSTEAWKELDSAFPDDLNGSRILFTSRYEKVGLEAQHDSVPHPLRFLNEGESWQLLKEKVFQEDECPQELMQVGLEIAKGCKGLPLAIVAVAGVLKAKENEADWWKQIKKDLNSHILENPEIQCMHILELSYNHLPDELKPCFLYFAAFGEDNEVPVQKLVQLWIAEGFVRKVRHQNSSLEDVAESYVMNLVDRSLLMVAKKGSNGRVKACKIHDMLHKLCLKKVEEDNFLLSINGYEKLFPFTTSRSDYGVDSDYPSVSISYDQQHRVSICSKRKHFVTLKPSGPPVCTLLFFATSDSYPRCPYDVSFIAKKFKRLKVLDIETINIGHSFPMGFELLDRLRYLAISGNIHSVPSTIFKLCNLVTFIVKGLIGNVALPNTLWIMSSLRHLHVNSGATFSLQNGSDLQSSPELDNMVSLSTPVFSPGDNAEEIMKKFPKLRKLRCTFSESSQHSGKSICFPVLDFLTELESLKIIYYGSPLHSCQLSFPRNLKKLSLLDFSLTWDDFSAVGKLPNLKVLKLVSVAFENSVWDMKDDEFQQLEYLKLESLKIVKWKASGDQPQNLEQLVLWNCMKLEEVPSSFGDITTLQMIELKWCSRSAENSVKAIQEQQLEYGNNGFKAIINAHAAD